MIEWRPVGQEQKEVEVVKSNHWATASKPWERLWWQDHAAKEQSGMYTPSAQECPVVAPSRDAPMSARRPAHSAVTSTLSVCGGSCRKRGQRYCSGCGWRGGARSHL